MNTPPLTTHSITTRTKTTALPAPHPAVSTGAGKALDVAWLRAQRPPRHDIPLLIGRIRAHLDTHDGYVSLSGGKDSLVVLDLALQADPAVPVAFFDSGLEFPETIAYLDALEAFYGIHIHTYRARPSLLDLLRDSGAWSHDTPTTRGPSIQRVLIDSPARAAAADHGPGVLWGLRAQESRQRAALFTRSLPKTCSCCPDEARRRAHHGGITTSAAGIRYSPIWDWSTTDVWNHITRRELPINPVYTKLQRLGAPADAQRVSHIIDGTHIDDGRLTWIKAGWPELWEPLRSALPRINDFT